MSLCYAVSCLHDRKMYAETHTLPFQLSIFNLSPVTSFEIFHKLLVGSTRAQAISSIRLKFWQLHRRLQDVLLDSLRLSAFTGLERVVIRDCPPPTPRINAHKADMISEFHGPLFDRISRSFSGSRLAM